MSQKYPGERIEGCPIWTHECYPSCDFQQGKAKATEKNEDQENRDEREQTEIAE